MYITPIPEGLEGDSQIYRNVKNNTMAQEVVAHSFNHQPDLWNVFQDNHRYKEKASFKNRRKEGRNGRKDGKEGKKKVKKEKEGKKKKVRQKY